MKPMVTQIRSCAKRYFRITIPVLLLFPRRISVS